MASLLKGIWIYFIILLIVLVFGVYLNYRFNYPLIGFQDLIKLKPTNQFVQSDPCVLSINGGIPHSPPPDGNFQLNFNCPDGRVSRNYLRSGAINPPTLQNAIFVLSQVNSFIIPQNLVTTINGIPVNTDYSEVKININDTVEVFYE